MKLFVSILLLIMSYLWINIECVKAGYEIDKLKKKKAEIMNENKILHIEVSRLGSLERIENIARKDLELVTPDKFEVIMMPVKREDKGNLTKNFQKVVSLVLALF